MYTEKLLKEFGFRETFHEAKGRIFVHPKFPGDLLVQSDTCVVWVCDGFVYVFSDSDELERTLVLWVERV